MVALTINGRVVEALKGTMLVDAAAAVGIEIPIFCYEPRLGAPIGACRMCLVEVEGMRDLQTACSTPVSPDLVVTTTSDQVKDAQDGVLEMLLANHPLDCPVCDKGGECPLQDLTFQFGPGRTRFQEAKRHFPKPLDLSPLVALDRERCIACFRCVRFSQDVAEDGQLTFQERSDHTEVATFSGEPYLGRFTGNTIDLCPVGALTSNPYRFVSRPWEINTTPSICAGCAMGCNIEVTERDNTVKRLTSRPEPNLAVEEGWICDRGRWAFPALRSDDRLAAAVLVDTAGRRRVLLERAIDELAARFVRPGVRAGILLGNPVTVEDGFLALELAARTNNAMVRRMGVPGAGLAPLRALPGAQMDDIDGADLVLVVGGDPSAQQPVAELRIRKAHRRGARVVMMTPRPTALDDICEVVRMAPGDDPDALATAHGLLATTTHAVVLWDEADLGRLPVMATALADIVAAIPGARAIEMSADVSGPGLRALGIGTGDLLEACEAGAIDVLISVNADPLSGPEGDRWADALEQVRDIVAMSAYRTRLTDRATLVFPLLTPLEVEGVLVSMTGRAQRLRPGAREVPGAAAAWEIVIALTHRLGRAVPDRTPAQAFARAAEMFPALAGLTYDALGTMGAQIARGARATDPLPVGEEGHGLIVVPLAPVFGDGTSHRADALACVRETTRASVSPDEAIRRGLTDGDDVQLTTPYGSVVLPLHIDPRLVDGTVHVMMGDPSVAAERILPHGSGPVRATLIALVSEGVSAS